MSDMTTLNRRDFLRHSTAGGFALGGLLGLGLDLGTSCTQIVPIIVGEDMKLAVFWKRLFDGGLFTNPAVAPAVEPGRALLRTSCIATHTADHVDRALEIVAAAGVPAARARCADVSGWRFLEVDRFDRVGERGRRPVLTLAALDEYFGKRDSWSAAAARLGNPPFSLPRGDSAQLRWLDTFGQLIGNTDRHFGNVAFFVGADGALRLAPAYDMLPMVLAPAGDVLVARRFEPAPPSGDTLDVWMDAATSAQRYWREVLAHEDLERDVRTFAGQALAAVAALASRVSPARSPGAK
jgi:hypothetical protein